MYPHVPKVCDIFVDIFVNLIPGYVQNTTDFNIFFKLEIIVFLYYVYYTMKNCLSKEKNLFCRADKISINIAIKKLLQKSCNN